MKRPWPALFAIVTLFTSPGYAVVMRHDIAPEHYAVTTMPPYLVDMPHEGHGVLIAPQWIVTVAHTIFYDYTGMPITVGAQQYQIEKMIIHPDYAKPGENVLKGDLAPLMQALKQSSDIALIKLSHPVANAQPLSLYSGNDEKGKKITVFGRGATGTGLTGENLNTKPERQLNHFQNIVEGTEGKWLTFIFDAPPDALPLEGMQGSGDSGGPAVILLNGEPQLAGLSSWQYTTGDISSFKGGRYGTKAYQTRIAYYTNWITGIIGSENAN